MRKHGSVMAIAPAIPERPCAPCHINTFCTSVAFPPPCSSLLPLSTPDPRRTQCPALYLKGWLWENPEVIMAPQHPVFHFAMELTCDQESWECRVSLCYSADTAAYHFPPSPVDTHMHTHTPMPNQKERQAEFKASVILHCYRS